MSWINGARTAGAGLAALSATLLASGVRAPPLHAQSVERAQLHGCWKHDERWKHDELRSSGKGVAFSVICFNPDQTTYLYSVSPFRATEQRLDWRLADRDLVVIDAQSCDVVNFSGSRLWLSRCLYAGAWIRQCTLMNEGGKGCAGAVEPRTLLGHRLLGCWKQDGPRGSLVELCFKGDQSIDRMSILLDGDALDGVSDALDWRVALPDQLVIDDQSCRVLPGSDDKQLLLSRCAFMGVWLRQPERKSADDKAGPK